MRIFKWFYHAFMWDYKGGDSYQQHQCKEMVFVTGTRNGICCERAKYHLGKCSFER